MSSRSTDQAQPLRPALPAVGWIAAGLWIGIVLAEWAAWHARSELLVALGAVCLMSALVTARNGSPVSLWLAGLITGLALGWLAWGALDQVATQLERAPATRYSGECISDSKNSEFADRTVVVLDTRPPVRVEVAWEKGTAPEAGTRVSFSGQMRPDERDEWARRRHRSGVARAIRARGLTVSGWSGSVKGRAGPIRQRATELVRGVQGPGGDLLAGVALGDRRRLTGTPTEEDFRTAGLTHLVAVSGSHLVVVAALVGWLAGALKLRRSWALVFIALLGGCYVVITGVQPSAARAWMMACIVGLAGPGGRRSDALAALGVAACCMLVSRPFAAFDMGFQLSVAAVAGLVVFARLTQTWLVCAAPRQLAFLAEPLAVTVTAQLATLPLIASSFGSVSVVAPVSNLVAAPLIPVVLMFGIVGLLVSVLSTQAGLLVLGVAGWVGGVVADLAGWFAGLPWAAVPLEFDSRTALVGGALLAAVTWASWPRASRARARLGTALTCLALVVYVVGPRPPDGAVLVVMDVGQGDAILLRDGPSAILIDAGAEPAVLRDALRRNGVSRLDIFLVTHFHDDHYGGAAALRHGVTVKRVLVTADDPTLVPDDVRGLKVPIELVSAGDTLTVGGLRCDVVSPAGDVEDPATNESSVVMIVQSRTRNVLLTGDAEAPVLEPLVRAGILSHLDVFKVGHHGSRPSVTPALLEALTPRVALVSVGAGNRYGHPNPEAMSHLSASGIEVRRTDLEGDLTVPLDEPSTKGSDKTANAAPSCERLYQHTPIAFASQGAHVRTIIRAEVHIPDPQRAGLPCAAGRGPPEVSCG